MQKKFIRTFVIPLALAFVLAFFNIIPSVHAEEEVEYYRGEANDLYSLNHADMTAILHLVILGPTIEKLIIPEKITTEGKDYTIVAIEYYGQECKVKNIVIPKTVSRLSIQQNEKVVNCFISWDFIESITVDPNNNTFSSLDGVLYDKNKTELLCYPMCKKDKEFVIPDSVIKISDSAFYNNIILESITLPSGLKEIGANAFYKCSNLKTINNTNINLEIVKENAFTETQWLSMQPVYEAIYFGNYAYLCRTNNTNSYYYFKEGTTFISDVFFTESYNYFTKITIPKSVKYINASSFASCYLLSNIYVDKDNEFYCSDEYGVLFSKDKKVLICFPQGRQDSSYTIPESVEEIGDYALYNCMFSESILPENLKKINKYSFSQSKLKNIIIPSSVEEIDEFAFAYCDSLEDIKISEGVKVIGGSAFNNCKKIKNIVIPSSAQEIDEFAFAYCHSIEDIKISEGVKVIGGNSFRNCTNLKNIVIPSSVTNIGDAAFSSCGSLKTVVICKGVKTIGEGAFAGCSSLSNILVPSSVEAIGEDAFGYASTVMSRKGSYTEEYCKANIKHFVDYIEQLNKDVKDISEGNNMFAIYDIKAIYDTLDEDEKKLIANADIIDSAYEKRVALDTHPRYKNLFLDNRLIITAIKGILPENIQPTASEKNLTEEQQNVISKKLHREVTSICGFELNLVTKNGEQAAASSEFGATEAKYKLYDNANESQSGERALIYLDMAGNITELPYSINEDGEAVFEIKGSGTYAFIYKGAEIKDNKANYIYIGLGVAAIALPLAIYIFIKEKKALAKKKQTPSV